jgi:hypothetical protein
MPHDPIPPPAGRQKNLDAERMEQAPWLASINLDAIASALFPTLVIAGGWGDEGDVPLARSGRAFAAVCDVLARHLHAEHAVIAGAGHAIPRTGQPYNDRLCAFLTRAGRNRLPL